MVPCESEEDGPMAISRQMFREDEWHADAKVSVDVTTLQRLADELMALALVSDIQDHAFYHAEQDPGCPGRLVVSGSENNLLFARDGRFAIFDLAPLCGPTSLATALRFMRWSDFSLLPLPDVEMSFGSVRRYFLFEDSGLRDILRDLERHYRGQEGARLFAAIVRRSGILGSDPSEESIGAHHAELLATLERYTRAMDSGEFYPWLRALLDAERAMPSPMTVAA